MVINLVTRGVTCTVTLPWIALLESSVGIELVSSSTRVTSVKSAQPSSLTHSLTDGHPDPKIGPQICKGGGGGGGGYSDLRKFVDGFISHFEFICLLTGQVGSLVFLSCTDAICLL